MKKKLALIALLLFPLTARAGIECAWVPVCVPRTSADIGMKPTALLILENGTHVATKRPWTLEGRGNFWHCGERAAVLQVSVERQGGQVSAPTSALPPAVELLYPATDVCAALVPNQIGPFLFGAYYGPYEQLRRQIDRVFASTTGFDFLPVDVNQNGVIEPFDQVLLQRTMQGELGPPMPYAQMCLESTPKPCP